MAVKPIPDGYHTITPRLFVKDADKLVRFLASAFGAVAPGLIEFTRIFFGPNSFASPRVIASRALLVAV